MNWENKNVFVGVDLHTTQFTIFAIDSNDKELARKIYPLTEEGFQDFITWALDMETKEDCLVSMAIEATGNARYFKNRMESAGFTVVVINTVKFKVISDSIKKTDMNDAHTIATFLMKGIIVEASLCDQDTENERKIISERQNLSRAIIKVKNMIHSTLRQIGVKTTTRQFQSEKSRQQILIDLEGNPLYTKSTALTLKTLISNLTTLQKMVNDIDMVLDEMIQDNETVALLRTIPGVGLVTSTTIQAYIGDINRFENYKHFSSYCGLVPFVRASNERVMIGHITKGGPKELRTALVQVVMGILRLGSTVYKGTRLISFYEKLKESKGSGKSIIACARKLSRIIYVMLKNKEPFDLSKFIIDGYDKDKAS